MWFLSAPTRAGGLRPQIRGGVLSKVKVLFLKKAPPPLAREGEARSWRRWPEHLRGRHGRGGARLVHALRLRAAGSILMNTAVQAYTAVAD